MPVPNMGTRNVSLDSRRAKPNTIKMASRSDLGIIDQKDINSVKSRDPIIEIRSNWNIADLDRRTNSSYSRPSILS